MALTSKMSLFLRPCLIFLALTATRKDAFLAEAVPLQDCQADDIDLLLAVVGEALVPSYIQQTFLSDILDYFLAPDDDLMSTVKIAVASVWHSKLPTYISFPSDNTIDDVAQHLTDRPSLTFQIYNTTEEVEQQIDQVDSLTDYRLYVNDTFISNNNCNPYNILSELRQNSSHVALVIGGYIRSNVIERIMFKDGEWGASSCSVQMFLLMVGHDIKNEVLDQITQVKTHFYPPSLDSHLHLPSELCHLCNTYSPSSISDMFRVKKYDCYFLYTSDSPITWLEASTQCENQEGNLVSVESEEELDFVTFIINNYVEREYLQNLINTSIPVDVENEYDKKMYIGLVRDTSRTGSPFLWVNNSPLIYTNWENTLPHGGPNERCGLWFFRKNTEWSESLGKTVYNSSNLENNYNGWEDIGCGSRVTNVAICETFAMSSWRPIRQADPLKVSPTSLDAFNSAISRGEFSNFQNTIVSIPANIRDSNFASFFKESGINFNVFSCENEDGEANTIPYSYVCDHVKHCTSGRDENICRFVKCISVATCLDGSCEIDNIMCRYPLCNPNTEFTCHSGQCVPLESRCDVYTDCYDGSDEEECRFCNSAMCCDGSCLPRHFVFDGEVDCIPCDTSEHDESLFALEGLRHYDCPFLCNRSECVTSSMLNDNITQCLGPEGPLDEKWGKLETVNSCKINYKPYGSIVEFERWSPRCVYIKDRYGTLIGCRDMSHLHDCQNFTCPEGYVKCPDSYCIPLHLVYDDFGDCPFAEDELNRVNCAGNFACWGGDNCVHPDLVCDGYPHCPSGDDELNCHVSCAEGFRCIGGTVTVTDFDKSKPLQDLSFIDKETRYLDLSGVNLSEIINVGIKDQFRNVLELYLSNCQISYLDGKMSFKFYFTGVYTLDLSYNLISTLSGNSMLSFMYSLRSLNLSHNKLLASITWNAFQRANEGTTRGSIIESLDLAFTAVSVLDKYVLNNLPKLKYLNLSHTHISIIDQQSFPQRFPLDTLDLRDTPLSSIEPNALTSLSVSENLYSDLYKLCCPQVRGQDIPEHVCHAPASAISSCMDLIQEPAQRVLLWTVGVLAVTGNLVVITYRLLWDRAVLKKSYGLFVTNLSVSDLFMGVYLLIIAGADVIYRDNYVWYESDWRHSTLCQTAGFLSTLSSETSAFFILLVTIDRFLVIRFPFGHFRFNRWSVFIACVIAWSVGFVLALVPALPRFQHWQMYSSNGMCLGLPLTPDRRSGWEYSAALFVGLNFILFLFIACGQYLIYRALSENSLKTSSAVQGNAKRVQEIMVAKQLSLVVLSDFLCWFPIGIMGLLAISGRDIGTEVYAWSAVLVLPINSALNPVLYTVPVIMKKWEDFKHGNNKIKIEKALQIKESTKEVSS